MIDEHAHCYLREGAGFGESLLKTLAPLAQKALQTGAPLAQKALQTGAETAGNYLGEMATKGLIAKILPRAKKRAVVNKALVQELLAF